MKKKKSVRVYIDYEFDGSPDRPISLGLVTGRYAHDVKYAYIVFTDFLDDIQDPWVKENVMTLLNKPLGSSIKRYDIAVKDIGQVFSEFFSDNQNPVIVADYGLDISMFSKMTIGDNYATHDVFKDISYVHRRIDAYPTVAGDLCQHHAFDDAIALREADEFMLYNAQQFYRYNDSNKLLWLNATIKNKDTFMQAYIAAEAIRYALSADTVRIVNEDHSFDNHDVRALGSKERLELISDAFKEQVERKVTEGSNCHPLCINP